jgi:hypothetical protein
MQIIVLRKIYFKFCGFFQQIFFKKSKLAFWGKGGMQVTGLACGSK